MHQLTTPTTLPNSQRNALVLATNIPCQAQGCDRKATRSSNLCGLCERQFLEDMRPVFGKPATLEKTLLSGDREGAEWAALKTHLIGEMASSEA